ncbi:MAG: HAD family hydrolase [Streptosporangiaceae bacterium]|nr:haloacid dehalogenase [Actinomycetota bacterium]
MASLLVLWDIDYTLIAAGGAGIRLYEMVFSDLFGGELPHPVQSMAGRTDTAISLEVLTLAGLPDPAGQVAAFQAVLAERAPQIAGLVAERGRVLPGAARAVAALADGPRRGQVIQSLLTGNIPALAEVKLSALGLTEHIDFSVGGYGDVSAVRADLVAVARQRAAAQYGGDFSGRSTVLVGDTPGDIEAAVRTGARAVGVATGSFSVTELLEAGADAALPDLTDTSRVVEAVLGERAR